MALTAKRYKGRQVAVQTTVAGGTATTQTDWRDIEITPKYTVENPQGSDAGYVQKVLDLRDATGKISYWLGSTNTPAVLPQIGDEIEITVKSGTDSLVQVMSSANFGKARVTTAPHKYGKDSAEISFDIEWGFID